MEKEEKEKEKWRKKKKKKKKKGKEKEEEEEKVHGVSSTSSSPSSSSIAVKYRRAQYVVTRILKNIYTQSNHTGEYSSVGFIFITMPNNRFMLIQPRKS